MARARRGGEGLVGGGLGVVDALFDHLFAVELGFFVFAVQGVAAQVFRGDVGQVVPAEVGDGQFAEDVVDDRRRHLDVRVARDHAVRLEAGEQEGIDELVERHAVLQAERDGDGEAVRHAAEGGPFLVHVDEDFAERAVFVFAGAEVDLVIADAGLLRVPGPAIRQPATPGDVAMHDLLGDLAPARPWRSSRPTPRRPSASATVLSGWLSFEPSRYRALALSISCQLSRYAFFTSSMRGRVRHVDRLGDRAGDERLRRRHHADVRLGGRESAGRACRTCWRNRRRQVLVLAGAGRPSMVMVPQT